MGWYGQGFKRGLKTNVSFDWPLSNTKKAIANGGREFGAKRGRTFWPPGQHFVNVFDGQFHARVVGGDA